MSYTIENRDIVISGWEEGIFDDPYKGIYDMRNCDNITIPGEVSVAMKTSVTAKMTAVNLTDEAVTCDATTNVFTWGGSATLAVGQPIYFHNATAGNTVFGGMRAGVAYYVREVKSPTTFTVSASVGGAEVDVIAASKTLTFVASDRDTNDSSTFIYLIKPAGTATGNIMFAILYSDTDYVIDMPSGWTSLAKKQATGYFELIYKIAQPTDPSYWTIEWASTSNLRCSIVTYSGVFNLADPIMTFSNTAYVTNDATLRAASITTTKNNTPLIFIGACYDGVSNRTFTKPSDIGGDAWTEDLDQSTNTFCVTYDTLGMTTAGATGNIDATISAAQTDKHAWAIALNPIDATDTVFDSIEMGTPAELYRGLTSTDENLYFCYDENGRVWVYDNSATYLNNTLKWVYMNNKADNAVVGNTGSIICWKDYLWVFNDLGVHYVYLAALATMTSNLNWSYTWQPALSGNVHKCLVAQDDKVYFCNGATVGRLNENSGFDFDPVDTDTYTFEDNALYILDGDRANCLAELGSDLLIGGINNHIYPWDRVSFAYNSVIRLSENYVSRMVTINTTTYIFVGHKGRIFMTNGGNATPFFKVPEYLSNTCNPYINWKDATFNNNQLYFGFTATENDGTTINEYGGVWAINVDASTPSYPRLQNQLSYATYSGYATCFTQNRGISSLTFPQDNGYGLMIGWYDGSTGGVDLHISTPYSAGEAYIITDPINVGQFKTKRTFENIEYKLSAPLVANESVALYYRTDLSEAFTNVPVTSGGATGDISGLTDTVNFENAQWIQLKVVLTSTATNPSYVRLRELRLR